MPEKQKTLMFYINGIQSGGAERVMVQLCGKFAAAGYRCILVTSYEAPGEYPIPEGVERISMEKTKTTQGRLVKNLRRIRLLRSYIKKYRPDALISFMLEPNFRALIAAAGLKVKTVVSVRNDPEREYGGKLGGLVGKYLMPRADGCVFQTEQAKAWFPEKLQSRSAVIMNQVNEGFFRTRYEGERRDIVSVGRLNPQKNHAMLIRSFAAVADRVPDDLRIYGEGELREELEALSASLGVKDRVKLMGLSDNVPEAIKDAKVFALSSDYEGMPNALLEAMALGLPCVSTDCPCGGPEMVIQNGVNGLLIPVGDEGAMAESLLYLLRDAETAGRMGEGARRSAENYRPEKIFALWRDYIEKIAF